MKKYTLLLPIFFVAALFMGRIVYAAVITNEIPQLKTAPSLNSSTLANSIDNRIEQYSTFAMNMPPLIVGNDHMVLFQEIQDYISDARASVDDLNDATTTSARGAILKENASTTKEGTLLAAKISLLKSLNNHFVAMNASSTVHASTTKKNSSRPSSVISDLIHQVIVLDSIDDLAALQQKIDAKLFPNRKHDNVSSGITQFREPSRHSSNASSTKSIFLKKKKTPLVDDLASTTASTTESVATTTADVIATSTPDQTIDQGVSTSTATTTEETSATSTASTTTETSSSGDTTVATSSNSNNILVDPAAPSTPSDVSTSTGDSI